MSEWLYTWIYNPTCSHSHSFMHTHTNTTNVHIHSVALSHSPKHIHTLPYTCPHAFLYPLNCKHTHALTDPVTYTKSNSLYSHTCLCKQEHNHRSVIQLIINTYAHSCVSSHSACTNSQATLHLPNSSYTWDVYTNIYTWNPTQTHTHRPTDLGFEIFLDLSSVPSELSFPRNLQERRFPSPPPSLPGYRACGGLCE